MGKIYKAIVIVIFLFTGCKKEEGKIIELDKIKYSTFSESLECGDKINNSMLTQNLVNNFLKTVKMSYEKRPVKRLILMFHSEERGGSIELNKISIIVSENNKVESSLYVSGVKSITKQNHSFDNKQFYEFLSNVEEEVKGNNSYLFVIDIDGENIKCSKYSDLKFEKTKQIEELDFIN